MDDLGSFGFVRYGEWALYDGKLSNSTEFEMPGGIIGYLYAFAQGAKIRYIGKTKGHFQSRMDLYRSGTQSTNRRIRENIIRELEDGKSVTILIFVDDGSLSYRGIILRKYAGLEESLIEHFSTDWNIMK